jgi:hypothetical protein
MKELILLYAECHILFIFMLNVIATFSILFFNSIFKSKIIPPPPPRVVGEKIRKLTSQIQRSVN